MILAQLEAARDAGLWWLGVWALMTALDLGAELAFRELWLRRHGKRRGHHNSPGAGDGGTGEA